MAQINNGKLDGEALEDFETPEDDPDIKGKFVYKVEDSCLKFNSLSLSSISLSLKSEFLIRKLDFAYKIERYLSEIQFFACLQYFLNPNFGYEIRFLSTKYKDIYVKF